MGSPNLLLVAYIHKMREYRWSQTCQCHRTLAGVFCTHYPKIWRTCNPFWIGLSIFTYHCFFCRCCYYIRKFVGYYQTP